MKNIATLIIVSILSFPMFGQDDVEVNQHQKNQINFYATDVINGLYSFSYERTIGKHITANLGFGLKTKEGLINFSGIDTNQFKSNDLFYEGYKIVPEIRYYLNESENGAMISGFYFGAYLKYSAYTSELKGTFIDSEDVSYNIAYEANINVTSIGLMVGYKLPIGKHFFVDFLIAGPGSGSYNFKLKTKETPPDEFYDVINEALDNYTIFDLINSDFRFKENNLKSKFSVVSFRYGISVGYSF